MNEVPSRCRQPYLPCSIPFAPSVVHGARSERELSRASRVARVGSSLDRPLVARELAKDRVRSCGSFWSNLTTSALPLHRDHDVVKQLALARVVFKSYKQPFRSTFNPKHHHVASLCLLEAFLCAPSTADSVIRVGRSFLAILGSIGIQRGM